MPSAHDVLNQNGLEYTADNIDALMLRRYENKKLLRAGKHPKGSPKRTKEQDVRFADTLEKIPSKNDCYILLELGHQPSFLANIDKASCDEAKAVILSLMQQKVADSFESATSGGDGGHSPAG